MDFVKVAIEIATIAAGLVAAWAVMRHQVASLGRTVDVVDKAQADLDRRLIRMEAEGPALAREVRHLSDQIDRLRLEVRADIAELRTPRRASE